MAIAAPSFLGQTSKAQDSAAKQELTLSWKAAKSMSASSTGAPNYPTVDELTDPTSANSIHAAEPTLQVSDSAAAGIYNTVVSQSPSKSSNIFVSRGSTGGSYVAFARSDSGTVFCINAPVTGQQNIYKATSDNCSGSGGGTSVADPPVNIVRPQITPSDSDPSQLAGNNGTWTGTETINYALQWQTCDPTEACDPSIDSPDWVNAATGAEMTLSGNVEVRICVTAVNEAAPSGVIACSDPYPTSNIVANCTDPSESLVNVVLPQVIDETGFTGGMRATTGSWTGDDPISYYYTWQTSSSESGPWTTKSGTTADDSSGDFIGSVSTSGYTRIEVRAQNGCGDATAHSNPWHPGDPNGAFIKTYPGISYNSDNTSPTYEQMVGYGDVIYGNLSSPVTLHYRFATGQAGDYGWADSTDGSGTQVLSDTSPGFHQDHFESSYWPQDNDRWINFCISEYPATHHCSPPIGGPWVDVVPYTTWQNYGGTFLAHDGGFTNNQAVHARVGILPDRCAPVGSETCGESDVSIWSNIAWGRAHSDGNGDTPVTINLDREYPPADPNSAPVLLEVRGLDSNNQPTGDWHTCAPISWVLGNRYQCSLSSADSRAPQPPSPAQVSGTLTGGADLTFDPPSSWTGDRPMTITYYWVACRNLSQCDPEGIYSFKNLNPIPGQTAGNYEYCYDGDQAYCYNQGSWYHVFISSGSYHILTDAEAFALHGHGDYRPPNGREDNQVRVIARATNAYGITTVTYDWPGFWSAPYWVYN